MTGEPDEIVVQTMAAGQDSFVPIRLAHVNMRKLSVLCPYTEECAPKPDGALTEHNTFNL